MYDVRYVSRIDSFSLTPFKTKGDSFIFYNRKNIELLIWCKVAITCLSLCFGKNKMEKMKNKTFSADSVRREGYCIIWGVILLLHHTTMPASTMFAFTRKKYEE